MTARDSVLAISLEAAVPLWMARVLRLDPGERLRLAAEAGHVIASQGDTLQYGSNLKFGHGARQMERHLAKAGRDEKCGDPGCRCATTGQPAYSAGEVFNFLARGLACAAYQPGGVTFAGLHWCADHAECEAAASAVAESRQ